MNRTDAPKKQPVPFGINGSREDILSTTPAGDNQASYDAGFPPVTMILKSAGGLPPKGQDMNQILYELSALSRWASSGALNSFDATFATAISGYPKGAVLLGNDGSSIYMSTIDGNTNNPNSVSSGWLNLTTAYQPIDATLTALAGLTTGANTMPYFTGTDTASQTALTSVGRDIVGQTSLANLQSYLGLANIILAGTGTGTLASPGYASIPLVVGGVRRTFIIQWGNTIVTTQTEVTVTLPVAFPTASAASLASKGNVINMSGEYAVGCSPSGLTQIVIRNTSSTGSTNQGIFWIALGY